MLLVSGMPDTNRQRKDAYLTPILYHEAMNTTMNHVEIISRCHWRRVFCCLAKYDLPELQDFFRNPDPYIRSNRVVAYKENPGDTTHVFRVKVAGRDFVVKRYNIKGFGHWLRRCLLPSRAMVSWTNAWRLMSAGIATPSPVAVIERRFGPLRGVAYYITEYQEGVIADDFFRSAPDYLKYGEQVREAINETTRTLHAAGLTHDDWQFHNILLVDYQPSVLDLDHMRYFSVPSKQFEAAKYRDWDRLRRSIAFTLAQTSR